MKRLLFAAISAWLLLASSTLSQPKPQGVAPRDLPQISDLFDGMAYRNIGPSRGGRVTTVAGVPSQPSTFYMGSTGGGVWKTVDNGLSWQNISDGYFETASMGALRVALSNHNVLYAGTGSDAIRSNVITGRGVYKSEDEGKTWTFSGLREVGQIGALEIHPSNPDIVFVAAIGQAFVPSPERGVFRTRDGGKTWQKVLFISDQTGAVDLEMSPDNPDEIYASMWHGQRKPWTIISGSTEDGIFKSSDGGETWARLLNGLPQGLVGKSDLAVSQADPNRVYVLMEAPEGKGGVYRSDDRGGRFELISTQASLLDRPFYYTNIDADPTNADVLYVNSTAFFKSTDGGKSWKRRPTPHGDNHDMWINPADSRIFIQANDGGANVTLDGGESWSTQDNQPTAELYQVNVDDRFPYWVYAGQQDNTTIRVPSLPPGPSVTGPMGYWEEVGGCETGPAVPKPGDPAIVYSNCKGRFGRYSQRTGQEKQYYVGAANMYGHNPRDLKYRFQRVSPIYVSLHDPRVVYHGSQYLHRTLDEGVTWETISPDLTANEESSQVISGSPITRDITGEEFYSTIYAVQESPLQQGLIWVGANDGPVHVTRDGGRNWTIVTPSDLEPGGRVQNVEPSPHHPGKAYVAVYRYLLGDWQPYIYRTTDYGQNWTRLTSGNNGIPADSPTRVVREDPNREGLLYAGTEFGMYISFDDGGHWQPFQLNLPVTPVTDIKIYRNDLILSTMGRSFWILDDVSRLQQLTEAGLSGDQLFKPRDAYRMRYRSFRSRETDPDYPAPSAIIDYHLEESQPDLKLEIVDEGGRIIREFTVEAEEEASGGSSSMERFALPPAAAGRLSGDAGTHRFRWDLSHAGPWHENARRSGEGGPMVVSGRYQVRLSAGGRTLSQPLTVLVDPRVAEDGVSRQDLAAQEKLSLRVGEMVTRARRGAFELKQTRKRLAGHIRKDTRQAAKARSVDARLAEVEAQLVTEEGRYPQPMLLDQISYLYSMLNDADQKPGQDAYDRAATLEEQLKVQLSSLQSIVSTDAAQFEDVSDASR